MAILTVADISARMVRIEVDESDVGRIQIGQRAYVTAEAYENKKFWGRVVRTARVLGRKHIHSGDPAERVDTEILEALIRLDNSAQPQLGLRVSAFILRGNPTGIATLSTSVR